MPLPLLAAAASTTQRCWKCGKQAGKNCAVAAVLVALLALAPWPPAQGQAPDLGTALAARGYTYACWYSGTASGLVPRMTPFHPAVPLTSPIASNFLARYGAGEDRRSWARQEQATRMSQIAEPVVNHPSNPFGLVNPATWRLNADYPQSVTDLFALCRGGHGDAALDELERLYAALYPETGPTEPPPSSTPTPTPEPPVIHPPPVEPTPSPTPAPPPACEPVSCPSCPPPVECPAPPVRPRCSPLPPKAQEVEDWLTAEGNAWRLVRPSWVRQWANVMRSRLERGCQP